MSRILLFAAVLFSLAFFSGSPSIVFEKTEHDFGKVKENSKPSYEFIFKNMGRAKLVIDRVSAG